MRVISYWSGNLPEVSALHFSSFLARTSDAEYTLFWEGFDREPSTELARLLSHPRISVVTSPWDDLSAVEIGRGVTVADLARRSVGLRAGAASLLRRAASRSAGFARLLRILGAKGSRSEVGGWDFATDSAFFNWERWHTYRADIFRVIAPRLFEHEDVLWVDMDTCFIRDFDAWPLGESFVYRWDTLRHANNAVIFYSHRDAASVELPRAAMESASYRPWDVMSDALCEAIGLRVHSPKRFDPNWRPGSLLHGTPSAFMAVTTQSREIVEELLEQYLIVHWHNQWRALPEPESPWGILHAAFVTQIASAPRANRDSD